MAGLKEEQKLLMLYGVIIEAYQQFILEIYCVTLRYSAKLFVHPPNPVTKFFGRNNPIIVFYNLMAYVQLLGSY